MRAALGQAWALCFILMATSAVVHPTYAQDFEQVEATNTNVPSYYYYVKPGAATIQVDLLGPVRSPGHYVLSAGTSLNDLLALAGGLTVGAGSGARRREISVRILRAAGETPVYETTLQGGLSALEDAPSLESGDLVSVDVIERSRFTWRDMFTVINTVALVGLAIERFSNL